MPIRPKTANGKKLKVDTYLILALFLAEFVFNYLFIYLLLLLVAFGGFIVKLFFD